MLKVYFVEKLLHTVYAPCIAAGYAHAERLLYPFNIPIVGPTIRICLFKRQQIRDKLIICL